MSTDIPMTVWLTLAERVTDSERQSDADAERAWRDLDVSRAVYLRGIAEGLRIARGHQLAAARLKLEADFAARTTPWTADRPLLGVGDANDPANPAETRSGR
jgi:hypothetical protein